MIRFPAGARLPFSDPPPSHSASDNGTPPPQSLPHRPCPLITLVDLSVKPTRKLPYWVKQDRDIVLAILISCMEVSHQQAE